MGDDLNEKNIFGQAYLKDSRRALSIGFMYILPMLINFQTEVYHDGIFRLQLMREDISISRRLRAGLMLNSDLEYMADLKYIILKNFSISTQYDSDNGFGVGISNRYRYYKFLCKTDISTL